MIDRSIICEVLRERTDSPLPRGSAKLARPEPQPAGSSLPYAAARPPEKAVIFAPLGPVLGADERAFFRACNPLGFILMGRNCVEPEQVRRLLVELRACVAREDAPAMIDQEGGRVARLRPPHWRHPPPAARFGALAKRDPVGAAEAARLNARLIATELNGLGITLDCAPVVDVPAPGAHEAIGDRAFCTEPECVATLGRAVCQGLMAGGVAPVIKHAPGQGRARADSHVALPAVDAPRAELERIDFVPFRALNAMPWAITAHVLYTDLDADAPASASAAVIAEAIRGDIGFEGVLVSDDIGMAALGGGMGARAAAVIAAGCDVALHCSGEMAEMAETAAAAGALSEAARERLARGAALVAEPDGADLIAMSARLDELLDGGAGT